MNLKDDTDVVVIGAGAAGLAAAEALARAGRVVLVLEARERVGGRVWTRRLPGIDGAVELGAEFIHGRPQATLALLARAGIATRAVRRRGYARGGREADPFDEARRAMRDTRLLQAQDLSVEEFLARRRDLSAAAKATARLMVQGFDAADPARASARSIAEEWGGDTMEGAQPRLEGGYGPMLDWLARSAVARGARLRLGAVVREVRWRAGSVEIRGEGPAGEFRAKARSCVVTLPLGILQAGTVRFSPPLGKGEAMAKLVSGPVVKALLAFPRDFWREHDPHATFFHAARAPFPTFWAPLPGRAPVLVAWAGGPKADAVLAERAPIARSILRSLRALFGRFPEPDQLLVKDWKRDPFSRGAYSYVRVGGEGAREVLAEPVAGTLFFAGEATDTRGESGTVGGALESGLRAARQVRSAE